MERNTLFTSFTMMAVGNYEIALLKSYNTIIFLYYITKWQFNINLLQFIKLLVMQEQSINQPLYELPTIDVGHSATSVNTNY